MNSVPLPAGEPAPMTRSTSIMRVVLFPLACAPMFIGLPGGHPLLNAAFALGVTLIFLRWDRRSPAVLGLELTWRPLRGLVTGLGVGTLVISAIALGMWAVLVSSRLLEYELWNRLHARGSAVTRGDPARELLQRLAFIEMAPPVLTRALEPFPVAVRTHDALHLASIEFLRSQRQEVSLASYDRRIDRGRTHARHSDRRHLPVTHGCRRTNTTVRSTWALGGERVRSDIRMP